jgi:hypothetical protein
VGQSVRWNAGHDDRASSFVAADRRRGRPAQVGRSTGALDATHRRSPCDMSGAVGAMPTPQNSLRAGKKAPLSVRKSLKVQSARARADRSRRLTSGARADLHFGSRRTAQDALARIRRLRREEDLPDLDAARLIAEVCKEAEATGTEGAPPPDG